MNDSIVITAISQIYPDDNQNNNLMDYYLKDSTTYNMQALEKVLGKRFVKKRDKSTNSVIVAAGEIISKFEDIDLKNMGIILGNTLGGWSYVEEQLATLYLKKDMTVINPYVATAWFPTASQGELSIFNGILGYSKTFCGGELSSGFALKHAYDSIMSGKITTAIVGGVEAPNTQLIHNIFAEEHDLVDGCILFSLEKITTRTEDIKLRRALIEIEEIVVGRSLEKLINKISNTTYLYTDVVSVTNKLEAKEVSIETFQVNNKLFSLKVPKIILNLYDKFKNKSQKVTVLTQDDGQYLLMNLKIL